MIKGGWRPVRGEDGNTSLQLAILTPALLLVLTLAIATGRLVVASGAVDQAAADAARAASIARSGPDAQRAATQAAGSTLASEGLQCSTLTVLVDTAGFSVPVGQSANVSATVTCVVDLTDVAAPGLPGHLTETSTRTSPLDVFRGR